MIIDLLTELIQIIIDNVQIRVPPTLKVELMPDAWPSHVKYDLGTEWEIEKNPDSDFDSMKSMTHREAVNHGFVVGG